MDTDIGTVTSLPFIKVEGVNEEDVGVEEKNEVDLDLCFVCCSKVQVKRNVSQKRKNQNQLLNDNLRTVFLLRNLMQVPSSQLEENLKICGNPENWISLCSHCSQLANEALELHLKIVKIRQLIVNKTKSSSKLQKWRRREAWTRTRSLIINRDPSTISPAEANINYATSILESENTAVESPKSPQQNGTPDCQDADDKDNDDLGDNQDNDFNCSEDENSDKSEENSDESQTKPNPPGRPRGTRYRTRGIYKKFKRVDGKFKCDHCDELFDRRQACHQHELRTHSNNPGLFVCDFCGKRMNCRKYLTDHRRQVHKVRADGTPVIPKPEKDKVYICDTCGKTFNHPNCWRAHVRYVHLKKLNYSCPICGHKFRTATDVNRHCYRNHKEDPFTQQLIENGFKDQVRQKDKRKNRKRVKKEKKLE